MRQSGRRTVLLLVLMLVFPLTAISADPDAASSRQDPLSFLGEDDRQIVQKLNRKISYRCNEIALSTVIEELEELLDLDILIDNQSFENEGLSSAQEISLDLGELTAWQTLRFLLKPAKLTWVIKDGVFQITTLTSAENIFSTCTHDVRKLCQSLAPHARPEFLQHRRESLNSNPVPADEVVIHGGIFMLGGPNVLKRAGPNPILVDDPPRALLLKTTRDEGKSGARSDSSIEMQLARLICDHSENTWQDRHNSGGTVAIGDGALVVTQTFHGQFEVAGILQALEMLIERNIPGSSIVAHPTGYPVEEHARIEAILAKPTSLELEQGALASVLPQLARKIGVRLWIDAQALAEQGISLDEFTLQRRRIRNLPPGPFLNRVLEEAGLIHVVDDGFVKILPQSQIDEIQVVRLFDLGESSKVTRSEQVESLQSVISGACRTSVDDTWNENLVFASFLSERHLAVSQSPYCNTRVASFVAELVRKKLEFPVDMALCEFRTEVYAAPNVETATDLERILPELLQTAWKQNGSIERAGASLFIRQPTPTHEKIGRLFSKLDQANPRPHHPDEIPVEEPAQNIPVDDAVKAMP